MSVAAYVLDKEPPPHELIRALNYQSWGVVDVMNLPAGLLPRMNVALNYHRALSGYVQAAKMNKSVDFTKSNPQDWDMVSRVLAIRKGIKN